MYKVFQAVNEARRQAAAANEGFHTSMVRSISSRLTVDENHNVVNARNRAVKVTTIDDPHQRRFSFSITTDGLNDTPERLQRPDLGR